MKPTLSLNKLREQGVLSENSNQPKVISNIRIHKLKFYADQPLFGISNKLFQFVVKDEVAAVKLIVRFFEKDPTTTIRKAWLTPTSKNTSKILSVSFNYKEFPLFQKLMKKI